MPARFMDAPAPARTAGMVVPIVVALVAFIAIAIFGTVLAARGNTGRPTATQQGVTHDMNARKNSFSGT